MRRRLLIALMTDNPRGQDEVGTVALRTEDTEGETVTIELHRQHLPPLDEAGFIDMEPETGWISRGSTSKRDDRSSN